jgi:hypothetical protein
MSMIPNTTVMAIILGVLRNFYASRPLLDPLLAVFDSEIVAFKVFDPDMTIVPFEKVMVYELEPDDVLLDEVEDLLAFLEALAAV